MHLPTVRPVMLHTMSSGCKTIFLTLVVIASSITMIFLRFSDVLTTRSLFSTQKFYRTELRKHFNENYVPVISDRIAFHEIYKNMMAPDNLNRKDPYTTVVLNRTFELRNKAFWESVHTRITPDGLYAENDDVDSVIRMIRTGRIIRAERFAYRGGSIKWILYLSGGQKFIFKPDIESARNRYNDTNYCEKPRYEVAAFVIDRLLGYRRTPYAASRVIDFWREIFPVAHPDLIKSMDIRKKTLCMFITCLHSKTHFHCYPDGVIAGVLIYWLNLPIGIMYTARHPFHMLAGVKFWHNVNASHLHAVEAPLNEHSLCDVVRTHHIFNDSKFFMDLNDVAILDFLVMNEDRRFTYVKIDGAPFLTVHFDHGLSLLPVKLRKPYPWNISPVRQCCRVRQKTYERLLSLKDNFATEFSALTHQGPISSFLSPEDIEAITGRVRYTLDIVHNCTKIIGDTVFVRDT